MKEERNPMTTPRLAVLAGFIVLAVAAWCNGERYGPIAAFTGLLFFAMGERMFDKLIHDVRRALDGWSQCIDDLDKSALAESLLRKMRTETLERGYPTSCGSEVDDFLQNPAPQADPASSYSPKADSVEGVSAKPAAAGPVPISEATVPLLDALNEPCKNCGKKPIDLMEFS